MARGGGMLNAAVLVAPKGGRLQRAQFLGLWGQIGYGWDA